MPARQSIVSGLWDIRGKLVSGAPWTSGSGSITVPAGVYRILVVATGGGGAAATGAGTLGTGTAFYVAATSGGAVTSGVTFEQKYAGGGHGGIVIGWVDVAPGESISYVIGAGGTIAYPGNNGGDTTITLPSTDGVITCVGGGGAYPALPGAAGTVTSTVVTARNPVLFDMMANGGKGSDLTILTPTTIWAVATLHNNRFIIPGTTYGAGAVPTGTTAGTGGALYLYY
jgi:hypothetical protein